MRSADALDSPIAANATMTKRHRSSNTTCPRTVARLYFGPARPANIVQVNGQLQLRDGPSQQDRNAVDFPDRRGRTLRYVQGWERGRLWLSRLASRVVAYESRRAERTA